MQTAYKQDLVGFIAHHKIASRFLPKNSTRGLMRSNAFEHVEVGREGLGRASRIIDYHIDTSTCCETESHGHSVIVVGFDQNIVVDFVVFRRMNNTVVLEFFNLCTKFGAFRNNGLHAFGLLETPGVHISDGRRTIGKQSGNSESHCSIRDFPAVDIDTLELDRWITSDGDTFGTPSNSSPHLLHDVSKSHITLNTFGPTSANRDGSSSDCCTCNEVARRTGITFDQNRSWTAVFFGLCNFERWLSIHTAFDFDIDAKLLHQTDSQRYIWS
mmetsp:Transcript_25597/g.70426  ORF Transcript_25597/g.70426 Transcript_25597/m.70426 type:complete len:271 (-) Transcript_25597:934-1746(-)